MYVWYICMHVTSFSHPRLGERKTVEKERVVFVGFGGGMTGK